MKTTALWVLLTMLLCVTADARESKSDRTYGFRTSTCKSSSCFSKHPSGTWTHPLTEPKH